MGSSTQPLLQHDFSTAMQQYQSTLRLSSAAHDAERGVKPQSCL